MADISKAFEIDDGITLDGRVLVLSGTGNPAVAGEAAPVGSVLISANGSAYQKTGEADTAWQAFGMAGAGNGTVTSISVTGSTGLAITGSPITTSGTISLTLGNELQGLSQLASVGLIARTGVGTYQDRTIAGVQGNTVVVNGNGVNGSPVIDLSTAGTAGTYVSVTTDVYGRVTSGSTTQAWSTITSHPTTISGYGISDLAISLCNDAAISAPATGQILAYNGTKWANTFAAPTSSSGTITPTTSAGGNLYYADYVHNLNTTAIIVQLYDATTNKLIQPDSIVIQNSNSVRVWVVGNTRTFRINVIANGLAVALADSNVVQSINGRGGIVSLTSTDVGLQNVVNSLQVVNGGGTPTIISDVLANRPLFGTAGRIFIATDANIIFRDTGSSWAVISAAAGIIRSFTYFANSLDSPNTADYAISAIAAAIADPTNTAINVRTFSNTVEQGVGMMISIPANATSVNIVSRGRAATNPGSTVVVQPRLYARQIPDGSAISAWGAVNNLNAISIPANTNYLSNSQTWTLASLNLIPGNLYQFEFTRRVSGVTGGTNLPYAWYLAELTFEFF